MNIRIYNARILTMEEERALFAGEIHIRGNRIAYVGNALSEEELQRYGAPAGNIDERGRI